MRESRTYGSGRGACDETHVPTATTATVHQALRRRGSRVAAWRRCSDRCGQNYRGNLGDADRLASIFLSAQLTLRRHCASTQFRHQDNVRTNANGIAVNEMDSTRLAAFVSHNPNRSFALACQLSPAADTRVALAWIASRQKPTFASFVSIIFTARAATRQRWTGRSACLSSLRMRRQLAKLRIGEVKHRGAL
jgi:hypothetical protein